jgi:hypothetical protein
MAARLSLGDAERIASTPVSRVIAVGSVAAAPSVATMITASPFCSSEMVTAGIRLNICWKSGGPPERKPAPLPGGPLGLESGRELSAGLGLVPGAEPEAPAPAVAPLDGVPFNLAAIPSATIAGSFRSCESPPTLTVMGLLLNRSVTVTV